MKVTCTFSEDEIQKILSRYVFEHVYIGRVNSTTQKLDYRDFTIGNNSINFWSKGTILTDGSVKCELSFNLGLEDIENIKKEG
jgi:hypothetical protein